MNAIDKAKKEGAALYKKKEAMEKQVEQLGLLDKKYANDPTKLAANTAAKAKLTVEFTAL
jgi:peptidoglycan hydrolase CwlO-like protein